MLRSAAKAWPRSEEGASDIAASEIATLQHELRNDAVEFAAFVTKLGTLGAQFASAEGAEVFGRLGDFLIEELELDAADFCCADVSVGPPQCSSADVRTRRQQESHCHAHEAVAVCREAGGGPSPTMGVERGGNAKDPDLLCSWPTGFPARLAAWMALTLGYSTSNQAESTILAAVEWKDRGWGCAERKVDNRERFVDG